MMDRIRIQELSRLLKRETREVNERLAAPFAATAGYQHKRLEPSAVRHVLQSFGVSFDFRVFAFINLKGGVGKTTSSLVLANRAAQLGFRTCVLDLDAQASATLAFAYEAPDEDIPVFQNIWQTPDRLASALQQSSPFLAYLPSSLENSLLDVSLMNPTAQKGAVRRVCDAAQAIGYDIVILDCPPSLGGAVISSICAADVIVVPVACDAFSKRGLQLTMEEAVAIRDTFGLEPPYIRVLPTMLDRRRSLTEPFLETLRLEYGEQILADGIRTSSIFSRILEKRTHLFSTGVQRAAVHHDYDDMVTPLLLSSSTDLMGREEGGTP